MDCLKVNFRMEEFMELCENNNLEAFESLDFQYLNTDRAFTWACKNGYLKVVKLLLSTNFSEKGFKKIDINSRNSYAIKRASLNGHLEIVELLLSLNGFDEEFNRYIDCEEEFPLYKGDKININAEDDAAFRYACKNGHSWIIELLLTLDAPFLQSIGCRKININAKNDYAFRYACFNNHPEVVKLLLSLDCPSFSLPEEFNSPEKYSDLSPLYDGDQVNIRIDDDYAFRWAAKGGLVGIVSTLRSRLNRNKQEFYFYKGFDYYIVKPLDFKYESSEEFRESVEFDGFKIYYFRGEYIDDCIEKYKAYYRRFSGKSARF